MNDRAQGGSSIQEGEIEIMIHRRTKMDDNRGVGEPLNEKGKDGLGLTTFTTHHLLFKLDGKTFLFQQNINFIYKRYLSKYAKEAAAGNGPTSNVSLFLLVLDH